MSTSGLKAIAPVPTAADFLDIVLSKTQRKTPTVIHKNFKISRIRNFYMRKVKFTQDSFDEKLGAILSEFPMLDDLHPFLSSLMNVLYDKNHYKLALGQLRTARHLIDQVAKDYVRLLKFGDSLYRCKQLKRAALGRMATVMRRQKDPLAYLEQVRQHISRLPAIDPNTRTLLICGYPNVGKSSFINKVTRADVDVQPYAFTTKSLFVGHLDYKYLRWQVIDTPGILDHPLEEMNTIEMQSITALAHLKSCVLYFMDLSEQCGYTVEAQCKLFHSIKPLFSGKPTMLVINKTDVTRLEDLTPDNRALVQEIIDAEGMQCVQVSCYSEEGVMDLKNKACDALLAQRVDAKLKGSKINTVINRIHVAQPKPRDDVVREPFIPEAVKLRTKYDRNDPDRRKLEKDVELEEGGAGVYNINLKKNYILANDEWKNDVIPEIMDGKNIADFIDPDIAEKLEALEREEEMLEAEGFYDDQEDMFDSEDEREAAAAKVALGHKLEAQSKKKMKNKARLPRTAGLRTLTDLTTDLTKAGIDPSRIQERAVMIAKMRAAERKRKRDEDEEGMDVDDDDDDDDDAASQEERQGETMDVDVDGGEDDGTPRKRGKANSGAVIARTRAPRSNRQLAGLRDEAVRSTTTTHSWWMLMALIFWALHHSKRPRQCGYGILVSGGVTCSQKQVRATARSELKWCACFFPF
ncbi:GTP binding protein 4 [Lactifluus subvellereus]|nr:GTP binding protein 4 [Lactifluus subvellereus]